ncbi:DNA topoisomerase [Candidatus Vecturithrix granuli]|uniref:DNA topoisomerase n=1 Tax=Vecturithrix granuli TaxID=1499967 RepID=A0A081C7G9_VECG1|nr:DNA topoisomerase [Candidatus Vecturithrix granuli]
MMKALVLAEKPSVGKDLARVLGCTNTQKNFCEGAHYVVTWALGHLVTLADPHIYDQKLKQWRMEDLPMLPQTMKLQVIRSTSHQFRVVSQLMQREDIGELIIATDAGREGELVARWIMKLVGWKKSVKRLWISSQTDEAIRAGFANLKPGVMYETLYASAQCRAEADWLVGLNVTRALTCKYDISLNAGRVQTPTLAIMVKREQEIKQFTPVDYWTVEADFGDYTGLWRNAHGNSRIFDHPKAQELAEQITGQTGMIEELNVKPVVEPPPLAYDLTELQRDANRFFGFSAKKTLSVLQNLYEHEKLVTYPRTDSRYITTDMVNTLPRRLKSIATGPYARWAEMLLAHPLNPGKRLVNDSKVSDHHAIIPTEEIPKLSALAEDERKVYDLVIKRFLVVLSPPYLYDRTTLVVNINGERFYAQGKQEKDRAWKAIASGAIDESPHDEERLLDQPLQQYRQGEQFPVRRCQIRQAQTTPPPRYTEATLLTAMESPGKFIEDEELRESIKAGGLGTPATRAEIIEKLISNHYIDRNGKSLTPTPKAFELIELAPPELTTPELTAQWELRLTNIAKGEERRDRFMADIRQNTIKLVQSIRESTATYSPANTSQTKCPMCGKPMLAVKAKKGSKLVCSDKRCGYEEFEKGDDAFQFKRSKKEGQMNKRLIRQYSDHSSSATNLGELLKAALDEGKPES